MMQRGKKNTLFDNTLFVQKLKLNDNNMKKNPTVSESSALKAERSGRAAEEVMEEVGRVSVRARGVGRGAL